MPEEKLLVTVAPSIPSSLAEKVPGLDLSPEGIADEVVRAYNAGANVAHLHVWDEQGRPSVELDAFERTIRLIRARCDIIIEGSTGGVNTLTPAERSVSLRADVEMASLNPGSVNYDQGVYVNAPEDVAYWAEEMDRRKIKADIAIFEGGMIANALDLRREGWLSAPLFFTFVLGQKGSLPAAPRNLFFLSESVPAGSLWSVATHGKPGIELQTMALAMGGHVRAGFEDSPFYGAGALATSNAQLVERLVRVAGEVGRVVATPDEARELLGLKNDNQK